MGANGNWKGNKGFDTDLKKKFNGEYIRIGEYIGSFKEIEIEHLSCGKKYFVKPVNILRTSKYTTCPYCSTATNKTKTTEQYAEEIRSISPEFIVIGGYKTNHTKVKMKHTVCGREFYKTPNKFLMRKRCPLCALEQRNKNLSKTTEEYKKELYNIVKDEYTLVGEYKNNKTKIQLLHKKCGKIWEVVPTSPLNGTKCPHCNNCLKLENKIRDFLQNTYPQYKIKKCRRKCQKSSKIYEIDFFFPELNIGFELNGIFWHSLDKKEKYYHKNKQKFFKEMGISVYFIWDFWGEDTIKNIFKHILESANEIEEYPFLKKGRKYLYANKDLYPSMAPKINGYKCVGSILLEENIALGNTDSHRYRICNSGYWKYIKQ